MSDTKISEAAPTCPDCSAPLLFECVGCSKTNYPQPAELAEQQGVDFDIDDVRKLFEKHAKGRDLTPDTWGVSSYVDPYVDNDWNEWVAAWKAIAARQSGAQIQSRPEIAAVMDRCIRELWSFIDVAHDYDLDEMAVQALETAIESMELRKQPAQGIDLGRVQALVEKWDDIADKHGVRQFTGNDHRLFANELRVAIGQRDAAPGVQGTWKDHLLDRRNRLMNSYGNGDREDAAIDAQIAQVDAELAVIDGRDAAPGVE
jgi:hypothetical protein